MEEISQISSTADITSTRAIEGTISEEVTSIHGEIYDSTTIPFETIEDDLVAMEKEAFGFEGYNEDILRGRFTNPETTAVIIRTSEGKVIGYTYATPIDGPGMPRANERKEVAYVARTVIDKAYRKKGLITTLIDPLEAKLKEKGYKYIERHAAVSNGYADKIQKHYAGRIEAIQDIENPYYGSQRFFRIKL
ncbi:MAG TPA: GNAT family N-acetyltransferase [Candidatus Saccharimonadales bacterium]|nr:GNAT family N-acetyltransferase [Candidatus Saccharimonadales bacterium]